MPLLLTANEGQCSALGTLSRYTVPGCPWGGEVEASRFKCVLRIPDIPNRRYCLRSPMIIEVEQEDGEYVISQPDTGVFVYNTDLTVALEQFYVAFIDQFEFLKNSVAQLSPSLEREFHAFENLVRPY